MKRQWSMPFGAELTPQGVRFRLWAPDADKVFVNLAEDDHPEMEPQPGGWFELTTDRARAGSTYTYGIGGQACPDPASRWQPFGMTGPSAVVDPNGFDWSDAGWQAPAWEAAVVYELHPGTFSEAGDFAGIETHLDHLASLGVTFVELMPVAECPGRWNWGYDGVLPFAPASRYGGPEALKHLVQACHGRGIGVILDVVYNHFGPSGNFLPAYASPFFTERRRTPWGAAINFDNGGSEHVRAFFLHNALYWLTEFHLDGLRLDAVHAIQDTSPKPFLTELAERVRAEVSDRPAHLILENDNNETWPLDPARCDAQWNDDFHHALRVLITGKSDGYYADYADNPARHLGRALAEGFAYQGEASAHRAGRKRGTASGALPPTAFVNFLQNHDQVGNHACGWRLGRFANPEAMRAATAILLLSPAIPLLFMGQEWNAASPFPFFCDFDGDLAEAVRNGRLEEFASFPEFRDEAMRERIPDPLDETTFQSARLDWTAPLRTPYRGWLDFHRDLLDRRRADIVPWLKETRGHAGLFECAATAGVQVRWQLSGGRELRLIANLSDAAAELPWSLEGKCIYRSHKPHALAAPWFVSFQMVGEDGAGG